MGFEDSELPFIRDALEVDNHGKSCVMEVIATGSGIEVPVGEKSLGRLFNVLGETIDKGETLEQETHWCIHRDAPSFEEQSPAVEVLETGIKVIDLLAPYAKGGKIGLFGGARAMSRLRYGRRL